MKNEILLKRTYQIRKDQDEKLKKLKKKTGESESHYLREALDEYFKRKEERK
jgi:predicted DNA-binding protein